MFQKNEKKRKKILQFNVIFLWGKQTFPELPAGVTKQETLMQSSKSAGMKSVYKYSKASREVATTNKTDRTSHNWYFQSKMQLSLTWNLRFSQPKDQRKINFLMIGGCKWGRWFLNEINSPCGFI